jgi:hypothetical protein
VQVALQDAFAALDDLAGDQFLGKMGVLLLEAGALNFSPNQKTDRGNELNLGLGMGVRAAVLQVDDADELVAGNDGHGEKSFEAILGELVEGLKAGVLKGVRADGHGLEVFGDPAGNALPEAHFQAVDDFGVRVLGGAEDEIFGLEDIDETGVALHYRRNEIDDALEDFVEGISGGHPAADVMEKVDRGIFEAH